MKRLLDRLGCLGGVSGGSQGGLGSSWGYVGVLLDDLGASLGGHGSPFVVLGSTSSAEQPYLGFKKGAKIESKRSKQWTEIEARFEHEKACSWTPSWDDLVSI